VTPTGDQTYRSASAGSLVLPDKVAAAATELASQLVESAPDGIVVADRHGIITLVNRRIEELFGYDRGALIGQPVEMLLPEADRQVHTAHRLRYVAGPRVRPMGGDLDLWARRSDGAKFPVEVSLSPLDPGGEQLVIATVRDVSARRVAEQQMRNMSHLFGAMSDAVFLADPDTLVFSYVNTAACVLTGYDGSELVEMTPAHLLPELDEAAVRHLATSVAGGDHRSHAVATSLRGRDGSEVTVEVEIELPPVLPDQPPQLVVLMRDITARLALEAEANASTALMALIDDRERIAGDLHDTVIQDLFAAGLELQATAMRAGAEVQPRIMETVDRLDDVIRKIRMTIFHLTERRSAGNGLRQQVTSILDESARILGFRPVLAVDGPVDTVASPAVVEQLLPTLREALSNIARHARAAAVEVELAYRAGALTMTVADDGIGLPTSPSVGDGLRNLARRAEQLRGTMTITPASPHGTVLTWSVPT
jgi:PAS domain S-box-containing protein